MTKEIEKVREARRSLGAVCERLQCPSVESWKASERELITAIECLHALEQGLRSTGTASPHSQTLSAEMAAIRRELARAQALLVAAGKFYQGWARLAGLAEEEMANYTARRAGAPVLPIRSSQVVIHG
ncbi:MAG TPA: hypothetical protein VLW25_05730 [Bryobacteraceae bacterium]|nr:hypothetical protein [Bryobacteraceae bacterium]